MLTLVQARVIAGFTVYPDAVEPGGGVRPGTFYVEPASPRLQSAPDGAPSLGLLLYRGAPGTFGGGLLTAVTDLAPTDAERAAITAGVREAHGLPSDAEVDLLPIPYRAGSATFAFGGEQAPGSQTEFVAAQTGSGVVGLSGWCPASFGLALTPDGTALLAAGATANALSLFASYQLTFDARPGPIRMRLWCDVRRSLELLEAPEGQSALDAPGRRLVDEHVAGLELSSEVPLADSVEQALRASADRILDASLKSVLIAVGADGSTRLRPYSAEMDSRLNLTFSETTPIPQASHLSGALQATQGSPAWTERIVWRDLAALPGAIDIAVFCTVDFVVDPIDTVAVRFWLDGDRAKLAAQLEFRAGTSRATFSIVGPPQGEPHFAYEAEVYYSGSPDPARLVTEDASGHAFVLDLDRVGVLRVRVELGDVPFERVRAVAVELEHPASGAKTTAILDAGHASTTWQAVIRDALPEFRYRVAWQTDQERLQQDWQPGGSGVLVLDAPSELRADWSGPLIVAAGSFDDIVEIVVDVQVAGQDLQSFALRSSGDSARGAVAPGSPYQWRQTLVYRDGPTSTGGWHDDDRPVVIVGDTTRRVVAILPELQTFDAQTALVLVELRLAGDTSAASAKTLLFRTASANASWVVHSDEAALVYQYRMTWIAAGGERRTSSWLEGRGTVLVLPREGG